MAPKDFSSLNSFQSLGCTPPRATRPRAGASPRGHGFCVGGARGGVGADGLAATAVLQSPARSKKLVGVFVGVNINHLT